MDNFNREIADFNDAIGYLTRINNHFLKADISSANLDIYNWFHALMVLYRELSTKMTPKELEDSEIESQKLSEVVNKFVSNPRNNIQPRVTPELYNKLHRFEIKLRLIYKNSGLEMRFQEDPNRALRG